MNRKKQHGRHEHPGHHHHRGPHHRRRPQYGPRRPRHNVPVNIEETSTEFIAKVFCVGFSKENVKINLVKGMIYIVGTMPEQEEYPNFLLQEYPVKSFERWFEISETVDLESITATFEDGILVITAPKVAEAQAPQREVAIK